MRILIVEDDITSRFLLTEYLSEYGTCHVAVDGEEAVKAVADALENNQHYDLVCLDIKMPKMDGHEALKEIRRLEAEKGIMLGDGVKIIMTTTVSASNAIMNAFNEQCDAYLVKPISQERLVEQVKNLGLA